VSSLAPSAFLASAVDTRDLQDPILRQTQKTTDDVFHCYLASQLSKFPMLPPSGSAAGKQQAWDKTVIEVEFSALVNCYTDPNHKARLLAAAAPHSGYWLHILPMACCGLHLDKIQSTLLWVNDLVVLYVKLTSVRPAPPSTRSDRMLCSASATRVVFSGVPT
jgi:hypothetical protein